MLFSFMVDSPEEITTDQQGPEGSRARTSKVEDFEDVALQKLEEFRARKAADSRRESY
jgi:hypothetical protein